LVLVFGYTTHAMIESFEPGCHAIFTHSEWRGLAASRAAALLLLGGRPGVPCGFPEVVAVPVVGARRSVADICDMWSSSDGVAEDCQRSRVQAERSTAAKTIILLRRIGSNLECGRGAAL
jgi:hypothetical protein